MNHADDDWLYRRKLIYNNSAAGRWTVINPNRRHRHHQASPNYLRSYSSGAVADCFDSIRVTCPSFPSVLRLVFIGDSRIRNQFFNFVKVIRIQSYISLNIVFKCDYEKRTTVLDAFSNSLFML